ncbi:DNA-binding response OmpR family regulator [Mobilisporobacter senegalensis]|uniref:Stage 0 sporulation protein A homolog n=1 Tax=Mobilisporobacter senegalensis TaxID=1329262 RepID=A0A3N1XI06_9FIRM|nr:response regulator transcription factor [Mobilisporobacter senegalensis]ROR26349.1 DNA-binding response OmpR family regulator [Mobilisporobacter senegalensis]
MKQILILEDDKDLNRGIAFFYEKEGYRVLKSYSLHEARKVLQNQAFEFVIMDLNLPDGDGLMLCKELREKSDMPIIILTARDLEIDEVNGLNSGADDYIAKPFSLSVLNARVNAVLRRKSRKEENEILTSKDIRINKKTMKVFKATDEVDCSVTEYKILCFLMENKNQVMLKEQILADIWDKERNFVDENTLPVNIRRLRKKIEDNPSEPKYIKTIHGMGYLWCEE